MRKVHIISIQKSYLDIIVNQLVDIFGGKVELSAITLHEMTKGIISEEDIVVLSKEIIKGLARSFIPEACPIIIAQREVNIAATKELYKLPKGQQILVINDTVEHAEETAISLENIYFEHEYTAFDPTGLIPENISWIVTPGEMELVPKGFTNVIDIGPRGLDFNTVLKIANLLDIEKDHTSFVNLFFKSQLSLLEKSRDARNDFMDKKIIEHSNGNGSLSTEAMGLIIEKIEAHGFLEESLAILEIYKETKKNFESIGRTKVKISLRDKGINLTDQQLRLRLEIMQELGLLNARLGRGGTKLSGKGEAFLKQQRSM
ncbi:hypothetical protein JSQ81_16170 [Sporosarcina sp. Marseille-Q4063]|uniref:winged-helix domain-containing protein n=1 Tax=Sporosarcina sp. Marseille-Q4063 TaxID=2810514 RepID=UPI001BAF692A|nr:winged-helix domain-containing protein [Sporosarcina sp. Marseille-Q4063]QUW21326.1 hypothetical protein JSQ81_16170 [Sporosarcina sp. Marseille-Q4063]